MQDQIQGTRPRCAVTLVLGGARSGKSRYAQQLAEQHESSGASGGVLYVATATPGDAAMEAKIARHRVDRPAHWTTVEEPLSLVPVLAHACGAFSFILVDCLTFFVANHLMATPTDEGTLPQEADALCTLLATPPCPIVFVSNEVGSGVVPPTELGGRFRDALGELNSRVAALATSVVLMVAGLPLPLKGEAAR